MPDPFIMSGGWASPTTFIIGLGLVILVGWYVKRNFGG